jgi:hypothetical protein
MNGIPIRNFIEIGTGAKPQIQKSEPSRENFSFQNEGKFLHRY